MMKFADEFMNELYEKNKEGVKSYETVLFGLPAKITFVQHIIDDDHRDVLWYGGRVVEVEYQGYTFILGAYGDIIATLYNKPFENEGAEEIAYVKDKNNSGGFYAEMSPYIKTDRELYDDVMRNEKIYFDNNNWFEVLVDTPNGEHCDTGWITNDDDIYNAIDEMICEMQGFIDSLFIPKADNSLPV